VLTAYVRHCDNKFDYDSEGVAHRKHIVVNRIRYIGKESNNLDDNLAGIEGPDYLEYDNIEDFKQWILSLKPKAVIDTGISKQSLSYTKSRIKMGSGLIRRTKINKVLIELYKQRKQNL
jgi:hypothetical protein